jgi:tRNA threonylcarbamoyladenosine biosynthesis protein TsaB
VRRLLAIDTSTWWGAAALLEGTAGSGACRVVAQTRRRIDDSHAARLLPLVDETLAAAGWPRASLDAYAAVRGPGSFTGIRVGLGIVRGLGIASGRACLGVGSLEALAEEFGRAAGPRLPLLDAARGDLYGAVYDAQSSPPSETAAPWLASPAASAARAGIGATAFGNGAEQHAEALERAGIHVARRPDLEGLAAAAGRIAWLRLDAGATDGEGLSPLYLRPADAELKA